MRDIKFRAWDESEKQFWYFTLQEILERRMSYRGSWDTKVIQGKKTQYTGLKDISGKEIYEDDVLRVSQKYSGGFIPVYVLYEDGGFKVQLVHKLTSPFDLYDGISIYEVIGNIYENPELLEV